MCTLTSDYYNIFKVHTYPTFKYYSEELIQCSLSDMAAIRNSNLHLLKNLVIKKNLTQKLLTNH
jgi:hypothetical protein